MKNKPENCPHHSICGGRTDGTVTVCYDCRSVVRVMIMHYADGKTPDEQYMEVFNEVSKDYNPKDYCMHGIPNNFYCGLCGE